MKRAIPQHIRKLRSDLAYHDISQEQIVEESGVGKWDVSRILKGWLNHPEKLAKLKEAFERLKAKGAAV